MTCSFETAYLWQGSTQVINKQNSVCYERNMMFGKYEPNAHK